MRTCCYPRGAPLAGPGCPRSRRIDGLHAVAARKNARERDRRRQVAKGHGQAHIVADLPWVQGPQPQCRASGLESADPPPNTLAARYPSALVQTEASLHPGEHRADRAHHPHAVPDLCGSTLRVYRLVGATACPGRVGINC